MSAIIRAISYYRKAITIYQVHSPAVYLFLTEVMDMDRHYYIHDEIEYTRSLYLKSNDQIEFVELGAGSKKLKGNTRPIAEIAKTSLSPVKTCKMLFNAVKYYNCKNILELGTSLGISTCYLSAVSSDSKVYAIEGNPSSAEITKHNLTQLKLNNADVITGSFEDHLDPVLKRMNSVDLAYLDGNHSYDATIRYFAQILPYCHNNTVLILDDIYWSDGMLRAWNEVKKHQSVTYSIDVYHSGILFFDAKMKKKQNFTILPAWMKIWQIGLFSKIKSR